MFLFSYFSASKNLLSETVLESIHNRFHPHNRVYPRFWCLLIVFQMYIFRGEVDPHVFECVRRYTADYTIVSRR